MSKHTPTPWYLTDKNAVSSFWSRVDKSGPNGCWLWKGGFVGGYPMFYCGQNKMKGHRFSYVIKNNREITSEDCICHKCDNPKCVNPDHLFIGTRAENNADKVSKNRQAFTPQKTGEDNPNSSIKMEDAIAIWALHNRNYSGKQIADIFNISTSAVSMILNGKRLAEYDLYHVRKCVNLHDELITILESISLNGHIKNEHLQNNVEKLLKRAKSEAV